MKQNKGHFGPNRAANRPTHCKWGHDLGGEYIRLLADGTRKCCICENARSAYLINERLKPVGSRKKEGKLPKHSLFCGKSKAKTLPVTEDSNLTHSDWMILYGIRGPRGF